MKTKIFIVTFTSYTESDNYLHTEQKTFTNSLFAQDYYDQLRDNARENAADIYDTEQDAREAISEHETRQDALNRETTISREEGTEFGYQVEVKLQEVEIDVPHATDRRKYGIGLQEVADEIRAFTGDTRGEAKRKAREFARCISLRHVSAIENIEYGNIYDDHGKFKCKNPKHLAIRWRDLDGDSDTFSIIE